MILKMYKITEHDIEIINQFIEFCNDSEKLAKEVYDNTTKYVSQMNLHEFNYYLNNVQYENIKNYFLDRVFETLDEVIMNEQTKNYQERYDELRKHILNARKSKL